MNVGTQFRDVAYRITDLLGETCSSFQAFHQQRHGVVGHLAADDQPRLVGLREAFDHISHLAGVHEHAAHFGGLIGAAHPAFDAVVSAASGAVPGQYG